MLAHGASCMQGGVRARVGRKVGRGSMKTAGVVAGRRIMLG